MRNILLTALLTACMAPAGTINWAQTDLNAASVSNTGTVNGAALTTLFNGVFLTEGTAWQTNTAWWTGTTPVISFSLNSPHLIDAAIVQADNNDTYRLEYWNGSSWATLWNIGTMGGGGMRTRPGAANQTIQQPVGPVTAQDFRIFATGGDSSYSLSEIQLWGENSVPEPGTWAMIAGGLGVLAFRRRAAR